uniref:LP1G.20 n=1 Tax=Lysinibacillus sphaericus TaxID=1421 RepID=Q7WYL4_LYSSH|nr:LP1G.20 [Lysinibacillus sphaericus]
MCSYSLFLRVLGLFFEMSEASFFFLDTIRNYFGTKSVRIVGLNLLIHKGFRWFICIFFRILFHKKRLVLNSVML